MDVGTELRHARQRAGLSREQISQETKIQLAKIEALESNDFTRLPDGIYLQGIVRAYARQVGLPADELVSRLNVQLAESGPTVDDLYPDEPEREVVREQHPHLAAGALSQPSSDSLHRHAPITESIADDAPLHESAASDYAGVPMHFAAERPTAAVPRRGSGRWAVPVIIFLAALGLGAFLYERTRPFDATAADSVPAMSPESQDAARTAVETERRDDSPNASAWSARTPEAADTTGTTNHPAAADGQSRPTDITEQQPIPADGRSAAPSAASTGDARRNSDRQAPPAVSTAEPAAGTPGAPAAAAPSVAGAARSSSTASSGAEIPSPGEPAPGDDPGRANDATAGRADPAAAVDGLWTLDTRIETTSYKNFEGLQLGYRLELQQEGNRVSGRGVKTAENGRPLRGAARTPITVQGTIDGHRLTLMFTEQGARRRSDGKLILDVQDDGVLRGRFASNAARSTGIAEARRPEGN